MHSKTNIHRAVSEKPRNTLQKKNASSSVSLPAAPVFQMRGEPDTKELSKEKTGASEKQSLISKRSNAKSNTEEQKKRTAAAVENILYQRKADEEEMKEPLQGEFILQQKRNETPFQLKPKDEDELQLKTQHITEPFKPAQTKENNTGMPGNLKTGIENLSGFSMDDVKVHYNSDKPARLNALAYAQGTDIHIAPSQEKHLPHEAWHVVQQKQGRVKATMQMKGFAVNDDKGLEREADVMGSNAIKTKIENTVAKKEFKNGNTVSHADNNTALFLSRQSGPGVVQHVKGLLKGQKVKVHKGTKDNPIQPGIIVEVVNDGQWYKVSMNNGAETETWLEKVVYPESFSNDQIDEINREQVKTAIYNEKFITGAVSYQPPEINIREFSSKKTEEETRSAAKDIPEGSQPVSPSAAFIEKIQAYIEDLNAKSESGNDFSFDGATIYMSEACGAKIREAAAKSLGIRYDKREKKVSFQSKGITEYISVTDTKVALKSHAEVENNLKGEYQKALKLGLEAELMLLKDHPDIKQIFLAKKKITSGDVGEIRAANRLKNIFDEKTAHEYLIIGAVHFWGCQLPSTSLRDVSNELDHMVLLRKKDKYVVIGIYNTKAGANQQSAARKQNESSKELLRQAVKGEYEWTIEDKELKITYRLIKIEGIVQKGPADMAGKPFILPLGKYTVDENVQQGTIGASKSYDIELSNSGVLANALNYLFITETKKTGSPSLVLKSSGSSNLETILRGRALFEADQLDEHLDEYADWDELWEYLDENDRQKLKAEWASQ